MASGADSHDRERRSRLSGKALEVSNATIEGVAPLYLRDLNIGADPEIVERYKGGFVNKFGRDASCITELYCYLIRRKIVTNDEPFVALTFTDTAGSLPEHMPFLLLRRGQVDFGDDV